LPIRVAWACIDQQVLDEPPGLWTARRSSSTAYKPLSVQADRGFDFGARPQPAAGSKTPPIICRRWRHPDSKRWSWTTPDLPPATKTYPS